MEKLSKGYKDVVKKLLMLKTTRAFYFVPGAFFIALAFATLIVPSLFVVFIAAFFLFCGLLLWFTAWRLLLIHRRVEKVLRELSGRVIIHGLEIQDPFDFDESGEGKKIVYH